MRVLSDITSVRTFVAAQKRAGRRVGLVPTMGFLHEGHASLMRAARSSAGADVVVASIFVNPTQFGPNEDFTRYPRDEAGDLEKCRAAGCDAVFLPSVSVMYPAGHRTTLHVDGLTAPLCGVSRPGHFDGVCTVVAKLFAIVGCDAAIFGEKDYQQLAVLRQMTRDLDLPVEIHGHPIVREPDGLAMSSRNVYLSADERAQALTLSRGLFAARSLWAGGERDARALERAVAASVASAPLGVVDYLEARDALDLGAVERAERDVVVALAVKFGRTRLIDNTVLAI